MSLPLDPQVIPQSLHLPSSVSSAVTDDGEFYTVAGLDVGALLTPEFVQESVWIISVYCRFSVCSTNLQYILQDYLIDFQDLDLNLLH